MLTQRNILILDIILDFILIHFFHCKMIRVKILLFFGVDNNSFVRIDNKKVDISVFGKGPTQGLENDNNDRSSYSINFSRSQRKFCVSLYYNKNHNFLFVNAKKIYQLKAT